MFPLTGEIPSQSSDGGSSFDTRCLAVFPCPPPFFPLSRFLCCPPLYVTPVEATVSCYSFGVVTHPISTAPVLMLTIIVIVGTSLPTPSTSSTATQKTRPPSTSTTQPPNHGPPKPPPPRPPLQVDPNSIQLTLVGSSIMIPTSFVRLFPSPSPDMLM